MIVRKTGQKHVLDKLLRRKWNLLGHTPRSNDSIARTCYSGLSGYYKVTEEEGDNKKMPRKEICRSKFGRQVLSKAGGSWR